ncbi:hypothetical protein ACFVZH_39370 [Streptomyces sp. NPDC059534]|uniref:hypothetical protein n=1 Tax=Streptomyces sp. NPDC059534 TaxID=3346859 RepID=UPI0036CEC5D3
MAVVVLAKSSPSSAKVRMKHRDLSGWLGCGLSTVARVVSSELRASSAFGYRTLRNSQGHPVATELELLPLRDARAAAVAHPLAMLNQRDLATLLRLCEAVFCPGWKPKEKPETPPGFMAGQRGKGAATDRLAMMGLVLNARRDGRMRMAPGRVAEGFGRADATVARLMDRCVSVGAAVVSRLQGAGLVDCGEGGDRLSVPAVAAAFTRCRGALASSAVKLTRDQGSRPDGESSSCARCSHGAGEASENIPLSGDGWEQPSFDDALVDAEDAFRDQSSGSKSFMQVAEGAEGSGGSIGPALFHATHPPVVELLGSSAGSMGCSSGEAALGSRGLPERAYGHEDSDRMRSGDRPGGSLGGPLRGENPGEVLAAGAGGRLASQVTLQAWLAVTGGPPRVWAQLPVRLEPVLEPVAMVWGRLERRSTRTLVTKAVQGRLREILAACGPEVDAERILRERLKRRLREQGSVPIIDPVGWLMGRGLARRSVCPDLRCDDRVRMDTRAGCPACQFASLDARALRGVAIGKVTSSMGGRVYSQGQFEDQLRAVWREEATRTVIRHEEAVVERQRREAVVAVRRAELDARETARRAMPCAGCGRPDSAGLCSGCREDQRVEEKVAEAVDTKVAVWGLGRDAAYSAGLTERAERAERAVRDAVSHAVAELLKAGEVFPEMVAVAARLAAESQAHAVRESALRFLARGPKAEEERERVHAAELRRAHLFDSVEEAQEAADMAAETARWRTAQHLLDLQVDSFRAERSQAARQEVEPHPVSVEVNRLRALMGTPVPGIDSAAPESADGRRVLHVHRHSDDGLLPGSRDTVDRFKDRVGIHACPTT